MEWVRKLQGNSDGVTQEYKYDTNRQRCCRYQKEKEKKVAWPREAKAQQSDVWSRELESAAKRKEKDRNVRRMLKEVWLNIGIEKVDMHEGITVKALLDSGATEMFMDKRIAEKHGFKLKKLERPLIVRNVDETGNNRENIIHQVEVNVFQQKPHGKNVDGCV